MDKTGIQSFINYLQFEKRYSPHTIRSYHDDLMQFSTYLDQQYGEVILPEISSVYIRSWLAGLKDQHFTAKSINRKISSLKSFFKYHLRTGALHETPMTNISAPKIPKRLPAFVEEKDISQLLKNIDFGTGWRATTDRIVLNIFYQTGMRLSELINLKEKNVNSQSATLKVLGKGSKERIIPINAELSKELQEYINSKRSFTEKYDQTHLLVDDNGKQLYSKYVYLMVKKYLSQVTTIDKKSPHILRHTFATHLTNNGADLNSIKELLGHASLASTQIYTHNSIEKLKESHKKAHPKG